MDTTIIVLITSILFLIVGFLIGNFFQRKGINKKIKEAKEQSNLIIKEAEVIAESIKKDKILEAKANFFEMKSKFEEDSNRKKNIIISNEQKLKQKEANLNKKFEQVKHRENELSQLKETVSTQMEIARQREDRYEKMQKQQVAILEKAANLPAEEARTELMETLKDEARTREPISKK